jgi:hypothetical protein
VDPAAPARHAAIRRARRKTTTLSNQKQELPTTSQTAKAHGIGPDPALSMSVARLSPKLLTSPRDHGHGLVKTIINV